MLEVRCWMFRGPYQGRCFQIIAPSHFIFDTGWLTLMGARQFSPQYISKLYPVISSEDVVVSSSPVVASLVNCAAAPLPVMSFLCQLMLPLYTNVALHQSFFPIRCYVSFLRQSLFSSPISQHQQYQKLSFMYYNNLTPVPTAGGVA